MTDANFIKYKKIIQEIVSLFRSVLIQFISISEKLIKVKFYKQLYRNKLFSLSQFSVDSNQLPHTIQCLHNLAFNNHSKIDFVGVFVRLYTQFMWVHTFQCRKYGNPYKYGKITSLIFIVSFYSIFSELGDKMSLSMSSVGAFHCLSFILQYVFRSIISVYDLLSITLYFLSP